MEKIHIGDHRIVVDPDEQVQIENDPSPCTLVYVMERKNGYSELTEQHPLRKEEDVTGFVQCLKERILKQYQ